MKNIYANIALNLPLDTLFTYRIPEYLANSAEPGKRVLVIFGNKAMTGIIVDITDRTPLKKVKDIKEILDERRIIPDELIKFCQWVSEYYLATVGEVLFSSMPRKINIKSDIYYFLNEDYREKLDNTKFEDEILIDIIGILEKDIKTGFTKKQLEKKLRYDDLTKYIDKLVDSGILTKEKYYSKPTKEKIIKIVSKNFNSPDISLLIKEVKLKSPKQIQVLEKLMVQIILN